MSHPHDRLTVAQAAEELGVTPQAIRNAVMRGHLATVPLDGRTRLIERSALNAYKREHAAKGGKRRQPDEALTEQQRKQRAYQAAYYQRRKAARQQPAMEPEE